jgi:DNA-binding Lrp family transcriptional regulator
MADDWWAEIDGEILDCLRAGGPMSPAAIGGRIGLSEASVTSILSMLARQGQVRVCLVELSDAAGAPARPAWAVGAIAMKPPAQAQAASPST